LKYGLRAPIVADQAHPSRRFLQEHSMSDKVFHVDDADFQAQVLDSDIPVLVDFWAEWCAPCKMIGPLVDQAAADYAGRVKVVKVNVDHNQQVAARYQIRGIPALLMFKGGKVEGTQVGAVGQAQLSKFIDSVA
jgi:thioredoxin 1